MTTPTVAVTSGSKPDAIKALRSTWRNSSEHLLEQVKRFLSLTLLAALPSVTSLLAGGKFDQKTLLAFISPFAYTAYRQIYPALGAKAADSADGMTIVPEQVGLTAEEAPADGAPVAPEPVDGIDTAPTGDFAADGTPAPPDYVVPEGDAAP